MRRTALLGLGAPLLVGCVAGPPVRVNVPVPIECRAKEPDPPVMPTESLRRGANVDQWVAAAQAELRLREGYEGELRTALRECIRQAM